jgi:N-ethylmaleimide reductase
LVERLRDDVPLADPNPATLFGGTAVGYTDYPIASYAAP